MSRIGKKPLSIPQDVKIEVKEKSVSVAGPKGNLVCLLSERVNAELKDNQLFLSRLSDTKIDKSLHGLYRALIANMIIGVTQGYVKELEIIGVGFRAQIQGDNLNLQLGFSHPVNFPVPSGIKIEVPKPTQIVIRGIDKEKVGKIASEIRAVYPPEPYKGKGVRYSGEYVKKKAGKSQATTSK